MGKRSVRTITLSPQDIALLRSAIDGYQKTYLGKRPFSPPSRNDRMRARLRHTLFVLRGNIRHRLERDALADFLPRIAPVVQVGSTEFMEYLINPTSRMGAYWSKSLSTVDVERRHETDVDRIADANSMLMALRGLQKRLIAEFQGQEPVLVDAEVPASRGFRSWHSRLLRCADRLLESVSSRLREREPEWRRTLRASHREARDLRGLDRANYDDL